MKALLLALSGDADRARVWLKDNFPGASIQSLSRYELENATATRRLSIVRRRRLAVFVIVTERLAWQRGQNALLAFGALAGARRVFLIDSRGAVRNESRGQILTRTPARLAKESAASAAAVKQSRRRLKELEREVADRGTVQIDPT